MKSDMTRRSAKNMIANGMGYFQDSGHQEKNHVKQPKKALVVGLGAMGHYGAWSLSSRGFQIFTWRGPNQNLSLKFKEQIFTFPIQSLGQEDLAQIDLVYIAVKAFDLSPALDELAQRSRGGLPPCILVVGNGALWPVLESFAARYPLGSLNLGLSTVGVSFRDGYQIMSPSAKVIVGPVHSGSQGRDIHDVLNDFWQTQETLPSPHQKEPRGDPQGLEISWEYSLQIKRHYIEKWLVNCVLNSVCAAKGYGQNKSALADQKELWKLHQEAIQWCRDHMDPEGLYPIDLEESFQRLLEVTRKTAENENSMVRALREGKKTENHFLAGQVLMDPEALKRYPNLCTLARVIESKECKIIA